MRDACEYRKQDWSWGGKCSESMLDTLATAHTSWLELWVCAYWCVTWCVVWCVMCNVWRGVWVQGTSLELREWGYWVSTWHTWHNSHTLTCAVSVCFLMCYLMCDATLMWCVRVQGISLELREQKLWVSVCHTWHTSQTFTYIVSVCILVCYLWCVMRCDVCDVWCVSTDNEIGDEGSKALSQCLPQLTQLTHLDLSCECVLIDVLLGCVSCVMWCVMSDVWVQTTRLEMRDQMHWFSACHTCHTSHTLIWVVSVCILMCYLMCGMCDVTLVDVWCVNIENKIENEVARTLSQCLTHLTQLRYLDLSSECVLMRNLLCDVTLMCCVWVQGTRLDMMEKMYWNSAHHHYSFVCDALVGSVNLVLEWCFICFLVFLFGIISTILRFSEFRMLGVLILLLNRPPPPRSLPLWKELT